MKLSTKALLLFTSKNIGYILSTSTASEGVRGITSHDDSTISLHIMPPNPNPYQITYEDGTKSPLIQLKVEGDEFDGNIHEDTLDGFTVAPIQGGKYYTYLDVDEKTGDTFETNLVAGIDDPYTSKVHKEPFKRAQEIKTHLPHMFGDDGERKLQNNFRAGNDNDQQEHRRTIITSGTLKNLVIPFKFSDHTSRPLPSRSNLNTLMNNQGPDALCPTGSVRDVYLENSFDTLDLQSTVIDWVTLDFTEAYCANGSSGLSKDGWFHRCIINALDKAVAAGVDFSDYDLDGNGVIDSITFFHSGYAAEFGGNDAYGTPRSSRIWSHK